MPYDPVTLAYQPDPAITQRNRRAWAAVVLPPAIIGVLGFSHAIWFSTLALVAATILSASAAMPLARSVRALAPFHPPARLLGASLAGLALLILAFCLLVYGRVSGVGGTIEWRFVGVATLWIAAPLAAIAYARIGAACARRASAMNPPFRRTTRRASGEAAPP